MAFDTGARKLWAVLAIAAALLAIGSSYKRGGLAGLRDLTRDTLQSVGLYRETPTSGTSNASRYEPDASKASATLAADEIFWLTIKDSRAIALFDEFLRKFPNSPHAQEARVKWEELKKVPQPPVVQERGRGPMMMSPGTQDRRPDSGG